MSDICIGGSCPDCGMQYGGHSAYCSVRNSPVQTDQERIKELETRVTALERELSLLRHRPAIEPELPMPGDPFSVTHWATCSGKQ